MSGSRRVAIVLAAVFLWVSGAKAGLVIGPHEQHWREPRSIMPSTTTHQASFDVGDPYVVLEPHGLRTRYVPGALATTIRPIPTTWDAKIVLIPTQCDAEIVLLDVGHGQSSLDAQQARSPAVDLSRSPRQVGNPPLAPVKR